MGDAVYTDDLKRVYHSSNNTAPMSFVVSQFKKSKEFKSYKTLQEQCRVIGVWDDHDYGVNNGDMNHYFKDIQRDIFLDFLDEPSDSDRRV